MFGDMMGQMEDMQAKLRERLRGITLEAEAGDGLIQVTANAAREITNVKIDPSLLDEERSEELEDLLLAALNRALTAAGEREATESQAALRDMLPPGFGDMGGMFGGM